MSTQDNDDDDGVMQDGGHTPANRLTETYRLWFIAFLFDTSDLCYCRPIPVNTEYLLTSIICSYHRLELRAQYGDQFFKGDP